MAKIKPKIERIMVFKIKFLKLIIGFKDRLIRKRGINIWIRNVNNAIVISKKILMICLM